MDIRTIGIPRHNPIIDNIKVYGRELTFGEMSELLRDVRDKYGH